MRSMTLFVIAIAAALGIGALTVTGQEDGRADLIRKIKELEQLLEKQAKQRKTPQDKFLIRRFYDVGALNATVSDEMRRPSNLAVSHFTPPEAPELPEPAAPFEIDGLVDLIRTTVETETWDSFAKRFRPKFPIYIDATMSLVFARFCKALGVPTSLPKVVVLDKTGVPRFILESGDYRDTQRELTWAVNALLQN